MASIDRGVGVSAVGADSRAIWQINELLESGDELWREDPLRRDFHAVD